MSMLHCLLAELKAEFHRSENGKERSIWFRQSLFAIILSLTSSKTSNLERARPHHASTLLLTSGSLPA